MVQQGMSETEREQVLTLWLYEEGPFPNNAALPALVYHRAFEPSSDLVARIEQTFAANGWTNGWRNGVYPFHHYHSTAHEVLGCYRGQASVQLGGPGGPLITIACGDVLVIPAGVAHRAERKSTDFAVVGCYANGAEYDMRSGDPEELVEASARIARVALPTCDPVHGSSGPLLLHWQPS
jgi:uncharacterized protein YjlB